MDLKKLFDSWGQAARKDYAQKQWLLSKWEVVEGIEWPQEKIRLMIMTISAGLELKSTDSLVDLGCGGGWILQALGPMVGRIAGVDFSLSMLDNALMICPQDTFLGGEIGWLPFRDGSWDKALSYFVFLNFMEDDFVDKALADVFRILKKGGRAMIGQLPDRTRSQDYDRAKQDYLQYCRETFQLGKSNREVCQASFFLRSG